MRLLHQRNRQIDVLASEVAALEAECFTGPDPFDYFQRLEGDVAFFIPRNVVDGEREGAAARAKAAFEPSFGEIIEKSDFFRDADRIPERQDVNQSAEADLFAAL